jgi:threonine/homoserine/homoserine lactone efflux protein
MTASLLAFIPVALLLTLIPGADTALVTRNVLALGERGARWSILGIATGCLMHATASALGLSVILATSARAYEMVKLAGAAYLVWIGVQSIRGASTATATADPSTELGMTAGASRADGHPERAQRVEGSAVHSPFAQGFLTNALNPKVALFYLTFLPQFIPAGAPVLRTSLLLAMIHNVLGFAWLSLYAHFVNRLRAALTRPVVKAWLERFTGGALVLLGARLAWSRR